MKKGVLAVVTAVVLVCGQSVMAEEEAAAGPEAPVVSVTPMGEQVVTVNSGNETVDAAANFAVKCAEKAAAMKTCDSAGAFKAIACRKMAEMRYKGVECPIQ